MLCNLEHFHGILACGVTKQQQYNITCYLSNCALKTKPRWDCSLAALEAMKYPSLLHGWHPCHVTCHVTFNYDSKRSGVNLPAARWSVSLPLRLCLRLHNSYSICKACCHQSEWDSEVVFLLPLFALLANMSPTITPGSGRHDKYTKLF